MGEEIPDLTNPVKGTDYAVDGLIGNDTLGGSISMKYQKDGTDVTPSNATAGEYDIVVSGVIENGNYEVTYSNSKLTISNRSGGGGVTTYQVEVEDTANGEVKSSHSRASQGTTVTLTVTPNEGYELASLTITKNNGDEVKFTDKGNNKFEFVMPVGSVSVKAIFRCTGSELCPSRHLTDVLLKAWYHEAVDYVVEHGIMTGTSATSFEPNTTLSRAMVAQILYNLEGQPAVEGESTFIDVSDHWAIDAITWAQGTGVVNGYENNTFRPNRAVSPRGAGSDALQLRQGQGL